MGYEKRDSAKTYSPADGDTLKSVAEAETAAGNPVTWQDIAKFNWGTDDPKIADEMLRDELGCYLRGEDKGFVISADCEVRTPLLIPKAFTKSGLATTQTHTLTVSKKPAPPKQFVGCAAVKGATFEFDKSFLRPSVAGDLKGVEAGLKKFPDAKVMIFGHTDKVGTQKYNKGLSERRARSVYAFITNQADIWEELYNQEHWGIRCVQEILKDMGDPYDPGPVDGKDGPQTQKAVKQFQTDNGLPPTGQAGAATRKKLFEAYMDGKHDIEVDDGRFMDPKHMGCGEFNPLIETDDECETNRRVTFYLFSPSRIPNLPCKHGDLAPCKKQIKEPLPRYFPSFHCSFYDSLAKECGCEVGPVVLGTYGILSLTVPDRIAPGKETIKIAYEIDNAAGLMTEAKLELSRASDGTVLWTRPLSADEYTNGAHTIDWDGKIDAHADFPDSFVTLEFSPYQFKITVSGTGMGAPLTQEAQIKVELAKFLIELAPKTHLTEASDQRIYAQVGAIPATSTVELRLDSDLYAVLGGDMNDNTQFTEFQTLWGNGPRIPFLATVLVFDSAGKETRAGMALGRSRVLWDYTDPAQSITTYLSTKAGAFITSALAYDTTSVQSAGGDNCHDDRGGKRTSATDPVLVAADGKVQNFPFAVAAGGTRTWAAFSEFQKTGDLEAKTGVVFRPARTAGDNYTLTAYFDANKSLDTADASPAGALKQQAVGTFETWRRITLAEHFRKCANITAAVPSITNYYRDAYILAVNNLGAGTTMQKDDYNTRFAAALPLVPAAWVPALVRQYALPPGVSQYDTPRGGSGGGTPVPIIGPLIDVLIDWLGLGSSPQPTTWVATFRPYDDFKKVVRKDKGWNAAQLTTALTNAGIETEAKYADKTVDYASYIATEMCKVLCTKAGITILQFDWASSLEQPVLGRALNGNAVFKARTTTGFALYNPRQDTTGHEIGHCMFLPHAPRPGVTATTIANEGIQRDRHDGNDMNCLMSYNRPRPGFCGLCLLRLRGWDATQFDRNGGTVAKA